jgi:hypothetical protein
MTMVLWMLDGTVMKIVNSKILVQRVVCYFVIDTLALDE